MAGIDEALDFVFLASLTSDFHRHAAFQNLREAHHKTQTELDELKTKFRRVEETVRDKDRDILAMKTDCTLLIPDLHARYNFSNLCVAIEADCEKTVDAVGTDQLDALERLKQSDQLIAASLRTELDSLRSRYSSLEVENNMHKGQLLEALMAKEKLAKELQNAPEGSETPAPAGVDEDALKNYKSKAEKLRERVKSQKEVSLHCKLGFYLVSGGVFGEDFVGCERGVPFWWFYLDSAIPRALWKEFTYLLA